MVVPAPARPSLWLLTLALAGSLVACRHAAWPSAPPPLGGAAGDPPSAPTIAPADAAAPAPAAPAPAAAPGGLTLAQAVQVALRQNPDVGLARARIEGAWAALAGARVASRPTVSGDVSVVGGDSPSTYLFKRIDARDLAPNTDFNDPGRFWNLETGATLRWTLWDGGRRKLGERAAAAGIGAACSQREAVQNELVASVASTFLQAKTAEELLAADDASVKTMEASVEETRVKVQHGAALESDLLTLQVRLSEAKERRIRTDVARRTALAGLRHLLALPADAPLVLAGTDLGGTDLPPDSQSALVEAYRRRPEMRAIRGALEQARLEEERARRGRRPRVDLQARWYGDDEGLRLSSNWTVALAVTFDLYDGGRTRADVARARAMVDQLREQDRKAVLDIALDVETTWLQLEEARARLGVATQAVGAAEKTLDLVEKQYRAGSATVTRYLEAESDRTRARANRIRATLDTDRAVVNARRAVGRLARESIR